MIAGSRSMTTLNVCPNPQTFSSLSCKPQKFAGSSGAANFCVRTKIADKIASNICTTNAMAGLRKRKYMRRRPRRAGHMNRGENPLSFCVESVKRRTRACIEDSEQDNGVSRPLPSGSYRMQTKAVEKPIRMRNSGTRNDSLCTRLRSIDVPSSSSISLGGIAMAVIMDVSRNRAKHTTSARRIFAMSLYLRKYFRSVIKAARCDDDDRAHI